MNETVYVLSIPQVAKNEAQEKKTTQDVVFKKTLDAAAFQTTLKGTSNAVLLDVRTPEEVADGKIPDAINIDFNAADFNQKVAALAKDKTYFVYCAKGGRSSKAVDKMSELGFKSLYNLEGGFTGWQAKGMPVKK